MSPQEREGAITVSQSIVLFYEPVQHTGTRQRPRDRSTNQDILNTLSKKRFLLNAYFQNLRDHHNYPFGDLERVAQKFFFVRLLKLLLMGERKGFTDRSDFRQGFSLCRLTSSRLWCGRDCLMVCTLSKPARCYYLIITSQFALKTK